MADVSRSQPPLSKMDPFLSAYLGVGTVVLGEDCQAVDNSSRPAVLPLELEHAAPGGSAGTPRPRSGAGRGLPEDRYLAPPIVGRHGVLPVRLQLRLHLPRLEGEDRLPPILVAAAGRRRSGHLPAQHGE